MERNGSILAKGAPGSEKKELGVDLFFQPILLDYWQSGTHPNIVTVIIYYRRKRLPHRLSSDPKSKATGLIWSYYESSLGARNT